MPISWVEVGTDVCLKLQWNFQGKERTNTAPQLSTVSTQFVNKNLHRALRKLL